MSQLLDSHRLNAASRSPRRQPLLRALALGGVALLLAVGVTSASIPAADGTIHGCYDKNSGKLRVIDAPGVTCDNNETAISWSQTGPQGPQGPVGPAGPQGETGPQGPAGPAGSVSGYEIVTAESAFDTEASKGATATCPAGKRVMGGGSRFSAVVPAPVFAPFEGYVMESYPPSGAGTSWTVAAHSAYFGEQPNWKLIAYAICANVAP